MKALTLCVLVWTYLQSIYHCEFSSYIEDFLSITPFLSFADSSGSKVLEIAKKNFVEKVNKTINSHDIRISDNCKKIIAKSYINGTDSNLFLHKLLKDSSKNKNDVGSYKNCLYNKYRMASSHNAGMMKNFTYLVITVELQGHSQSNLNSTQYETNWFMFGMCVPLGCSISEYKEVIYAINLEMNNIFELDSIDQLDIFNMDDHRSREFKAVYLLFLSPFFIMLMQFLFVLFPGIPTCLFKFYFITKKENTNNIHDNSKGEFSQVKRISSESNMTGEHFHSDKAFLNKKDLFKFTSSFNLTENGEELFNVTSVSNFNNESGLAYIKGIRGVAMFFLVFGQVFFNLYESPIKIYGESSFIQMIRNYLYGVLFYGVRFSPRILFSCSGFCLVYKLLCYLDDRLELNSNNTEQKIDSSSMMFERDPEEISYSSICKFYIYQVHKYVLMILIICFLQYSFYYIVLVVKDVGPIWVYFKLNIMQNSSFLDLLGHVFLIFNFDIPRYSRTCLLNIFWMVFNEVCFFIPTALLIFLSYKKKLKLDVIIVFLTFLLLIARCLFVLLNPSWYSTLYFYYFDYGGLFINPLYNYPYFLIGLFFGMMNYSVQKGITYREAIKQEKPYLIGPIAFVNFFKSHSRCCLYLFGSAGLILQVMLSIVQPLFLSISSEKDKNLNYFYVNQVINVIYLLDIEIVVFIFHFTAFGFYLKGENIVNQFLSNNFWKLFNRLYFGYILLINPVILYIFYQSETRIKLEMFNVFFYSVIAGFILLLVSSLFFIFFELPYKRITKFFGNRENVEVKHNVRNMKGVSNAD